MIGKVSVLITSYNYGCFLGEAIASVISQSSRCDIEIVVVDDGSTDDTSTVLEKYSERIRVIVQENAGQAASLNSAYREATGEIIFFLDADDVWEPSKVREVVDAFAYGGDVGLVHHDMQRIDAHGRLIDGAVLPSVVANGDVSRLMRRKLLSWRFAPTSGLSLSREAADLIFPLDKSLKGWADELIAPICALVRPVHYIEKKLARYRIHASSLTADEREHQGGRLLGAGQAVERWIRIVEAKVRQGNAVLSRTGMAPSLSPWMQWSYVRSVALRDGRPPTVYIPKIVAAVANARGMRLEDRLGLLLSFLRKMCRGHETGA